MKYTNIKKLIIKFIGGGIVNFPTRWIKWIKINSCDCDGGDSGGDGGDSQDGITLEDFNDFYITVINNNYADTYNDDDTLQLSDLFEVPNINIFKGLLNLAKNAPEINDSIDMNFNDMHYHPDSNANYKHSISIHPHGGEFYNIEINTRKTVLDDNENQITYIYGIGLSYDGEDTLTVGYVNTPEMEAS
jgi:hypothetical protein